MIGFRSSVAIRKALTAAMYTKISKLSMRSLTETNSGKLITIVSGDLQQVTGMMHLVSFLIAAPFVNLVAFIVLGTTGPWTTAVITMVIWFIILCMQHFSAQATRKYTFLMGRQNDERQKLVNDMYVGGRTIKSYGWENHYIAKIKAARDGQLKIMRKIILIRLVGTSFFQNGGLLVAIAVLIPQWMRGELLKEGVSMAMMAMVYYIFISVNMMTYVAMNALATFLACIERMSTVYSLGEYNDQRKEEVEHKDSKVKLENCNFSWGFKVK